MRLVKKTPAAQALEAVGEGGKPLPAQIERRAAQQYGFGFEHVRVHDEPGAHGAARSLHAAAYTVGSRIGFAAGRYESASAQGEALLQHELRHVAQQRWSNASLNPQVDAGDSIYERDARDAPAGQVPAMTEQRIQCAGENERFSPGASFTREAIVDIIRHSSDILEVLAKLGFSPMTSPQILAKYFVSKGVTPTDFALMNDARLDKTPQKVMAEVLVPHPYQENRMISSAIIGTEQEVARRKALGEQQNLQIVAQGLLAGAQSGTGSASKAALGQLTGPGPARMGGVATPARTAPAAPARPAPNPVAKPAVEKPPLLVQVEIKPVSGEKGGWTQLRQPTRSSYGAIGIINEGGGFEGVATYNRATGRVELKVSPIGEGRSAAKTYQIGQLTQAELADLQARSGGSVAKYGNLIEARIREMISGATGQAVADPGKNPSKTGVDWRPQQLPLPHAN